MFFMAPKPNLKLSKEKRKKKSYIVTFDTPMLHIYRCYLPYEKE
jgi:hypothetical protein